MAILVFAVVFLWKPFSAIILLISSAGLINATFDKSLSKTCRELMYVSFGLAISTSYGFFASWSMRSGKNDIDPIVFFAYFKILFLSFIVIRIAIGAFGVVFNKIRKK